jgi:hypothetical protein
MLEALAALRVGVVSRDHGETDNTTGVPSAALAYLTSRFMARPLDTSSVAVASSAQIDIRIHAQPAILPVRTS